MNTPDISGTARVASPARSRKFKTVRCRHYGTPKGCFKGDACTFIHVDPQPKEETSDQGSLQGASVEEPHTSASVLAANAQPCKYFTWKGSCRFGDSCKFSHSSTDPDKPRPSSSASFAEGGDYGPPKSSSTGFEGATWRTRQQPELDAGASWGLRTITILSQDEQRIWTVDPEEIAPSSPLLASVFAYSKSGVSGVTQDPCKNVRGLARRGSGRDEYQLRGVGADDFDVFLTVFRAQYVVCYCPSTQVNIIRYSQKFEFSSDDLKVAMGLASDWGFEKLRLRARRGLENLNLNELDKVTLAKRCKDTEWIREAYLALAIRIAPLSIEEIEALGTKATTAVVRARERVLIQRLRGLPFTDAQQWRCKRPSCRQALRDAWIEILENGGSPEVSHLAVSALLLDEAFSSGSGLCESCASDEALAKALEDRQVETVIAEAAIEQVLGETAAIWMT